MGYVFLENQLLAHGHLEKRWAIGTGPLAGLLWDPAPATRLQLEASRQWFNDGRLERSQARALLRHSLGRDNNLVAEYEWTRAELSADGRQERRMALGWQRYF